MSLLSLIGQRIREYREAKSITQAELAEICGLHRNYITSVERGKRNITIQSLEKIAKGLNTKLVDLIQ